MQPTTIEAMEQGIIARLKERVPALAVETFPDAPEGWVMRHQVGTLLVSYRGADYGRVEDVGESIQERGMLMDIHVIVRSLKGHTGAYTFLEAVRLALTGYRVPGFTKLTPRREAFTARRENQWRYTITFAAATVSAELDEATADTLLQRITAASDYDTSEITSG